MDVGFSLVLPGVVGGLCIAALLAWLNRRPSSPGLVKCSALEPLSPDTINMAHIRVAGIGGLGLVAACLIIAMYLPELRYALSIGLGLGVALAAILIVVRAKARRTASGDRGPHANAMLPLDDAPSAADERIDIDGRKRERAIATA